MTAPIIDATGAAIPTSELEAWAELWNGDARLADYAYLVGDGTAPLDTARWLRRNRWHGTGQLWERLGEIEP